MKKHTKLCLMSFMSIFMMFSFITNSYADESVSDTDKATSTVSGTILPADEEEEVPSPQEPIVVNPKDDKTGFIATGAKYWIKYLPYIGIVLVAGGLVFILKNKKDDEN